MPAPSGGIHGLIVTDKEGSIFGALGIECHELARILKKEAHLFLDEGYIFGAAGEGFERWNLAAPTKYVEAGLERLKVLKNYVK